MTKVETVEKALSKLRRMKVNKLYDDNALHEFECEFDGIWWRVLHEHDMYRENEIDDDEKHEHLDKKSAQTTYKWLKDTQHLTIEFKNTRF